MNKPSKGSRGTTWGLRRCSRARCTSWRWSSWGSRNGRHSNRWRCCCCRSRCTGTKCLQ